MRAKLSTKEFVNELRTAIANGIGDDMDAKNAAMDRAKELGQDLVSGLRASGIAAADMPVAIASVTSLA